MVKFYPAINVIAAILIVASITLEIDARTGCASFGHSCYGGIGKRGGLLMGEDEIRPNNMQESENLAYEFTVPRSQVYRTDFQKSPNYNRLFLEEFTEVKRYLRELITNSRREDIQRK